MTPCEAIIKRINSLLTKNNWSIYKLALNSGVLHGTLNRIMNNENKSVNFTTLIQIAHGFDMHIGEFLSDSIFDEDNLKL